MPGLVGIGMLDAACPGQVFTSPTPDQMLAAAQAVDSGAGVLFIVKNYEGDVMNFEMAAEMYEGGHATRADQRRRRGRGFDLDHRPPRRRRHGRSSRRSSGAAAEAGADLAALQALGARVNARTRSMGVALTSCTVPAAGKPTFDLPEDEMEMGVGIHGEPGRRRVKLQSGRRHRRGDDRPRSPATSPRAAGGEVLLLVNGFGATPSMELYLMYGAARRLLEAKGLKVARSLVGNYCTSLDMAGCSLTVTALDDELRGLWDAPVHTAALRW